MLTKHTIKAIGYKEYSEEDSLEILFGILRVFSISGINFEKDCHAPISEVIPFGTNCTAVISNSINDATKALTSDVFVDEDEGEWILKKKINPPFLVVFYKESAAKILRGGYRMEKDGNIYLYDGFPEGKPEIKAWEKDLLPNIIASVTVKFSTLERPALLVPVEKSIFGITTAGATVFDLKITSSPVELSVSSYQKLEEINFSLKDSSTIYSNLKSKSTRHLFAAFNEKDKLKQFLSYFLFIERFTHSQYKTLSSSHDFGDLINVPNRLSSYGTAFFENQFDLSKNLSQRFHLCAMVVWENIDDTDVKFFLYIKSLRDKISHGEEYDEATLPVRKMRLLSLKLLGAT